MDAAHTYFNKTVLFLATALLMAAPGRAQTTPQFILNGSAVANLPVQLVGNQASSVTVTSSTTTEISFTATVNYNGAPAWLYPIASSWTTPTTTLSFQVSSQPAQAPNNATVTLHATSPATGVTPVTITVIYPGGSSSGGSITATPSSVTLYAAAGGSATPVTVALGGNVGINFSLSSLVTSPPSGTWLGAALTGGYGLTTPSSLTISANASGLQNGYSYYGTVTVSPTNGASTQIGVTFTVGSGGGTGIGIVTPTSLTFAYSTSSSSNWPTLPFQGIQVTGTGQLSVGSPTYASGQGWLTLSSASSTSAPGTIWVNVNPAGLTASATAYTATLPVTTTSGLTNVSVSLLVTDSPVLVAYPGSLNFDYTAGDMNPSSALYLYASDGSAMAVSATTSTTWLTVSAPTPPNTSTAVTVQGNNNLSLLPNGVYLGSVTVTATGAANYPASIPVVLTVSGSSVSGGSLTLGSLSPFYATQGGAAPNSQTLSVSASSAMYYTASATSTGNWLSISPLSGYTNSNLTVSVNQSGLAANTYYGTITLVANGVTQQVQVTLVVSSSSSGTGNVSVSATSLSFTYTVGGTAPSPQYLQVTSTSGSAPVSFTITIPSGATWLSTGVQNGASVNTPYNSPGFTISVNPTGLAPSSTPYSANITIQATGGNQVIVTVYLTVQAAATVTATATPLSFTFQAGGTDPSPQTVSVSGGGQSLGFTATATSTGGNWLSVSPASGTTPTTGTATLTVTATPLEANLGVGSFTGTILVSGTGTTTGSTSINVTLTVTAPLPTINSVVNAASSIKGSVSPGEIVTIYGTALGPATAAYATIDPSTGKLATTIGGVQVLFSGTAAPMIYASSLQVNAIVPYEMARVASPQVWVKYVGQTSNAYQLTSATTAPGLFTQNASGSGPGAILNQNYSLNGPNNPAAKGSIVMVYMTGEGQTSPAGVTGAITLPNLPPPQVTPSPLLTSIGVLINGQPAAWTYAGEAPGLAAGLLQLNVQIPQTAQSGVPNSITVSIGPNVSQTGVTVSVQ
jgi:uncharacterized protein (TIGR03437 family)